MNRSDQPAVATSNGIGTAATDPSWPEQEARLRGVALHDERSIATILSSAGQESSGLDPRTCCLTRLAALHATDGASASYGCLVSAALAAGATEEEVVGTLFAVAPLIGVARAVATAPELATALGFDLDAALELLDREID